VRALGKTNLHFVEEYKELVDLREKFLRIYLIDKIS